MLAALVAGLCAPAVAQQNYLNSTRGAARAPVLQDGGPEDVQGPVQDHYDDNVRLLSARRTSGRRGLQEAAVEAEVAVYRRLPEEVVRLTDNHSLAEPR